MIGSLQWRNSLSFCYCIAQRDLSPGDVYPDDRTGESNAAINARQVCVYLVCHKKAKDLDTHLKGGQQGGFDAELNTFG